MQQKLQSINEGSLCNQTQTSPVFSLLHFCAVQMCFVWLSECLEQASNLKDLKDTHQKCQHKERQMKRVWSRIYTVSSQNRHFQGKGTWHSHLHHQSRHWGVKKNTHLHQKRSQFLNFFLVTILNSHEIVEETI